MKKYTIGICFNHELNCVLLILKSKPDWQKGRWNFPGGKVELLAPNDSSGLLETPHECIQREFIEETGLNIGTNYWNEIGQILSPNLYEVSILNTVLPKGQMRMARSVTDEIVKWFPIDKLPEMVLPNIKFIMEYALACVKDELRHEKPVFATFLYNTKNTQSTT